MDFCISVESLVVSSLSVRFGGHQLVQRNSLKASAGPGKPYGIFGFRSPFGGLPRTTQCLACVCDPFD